MKAAARVIRVKIDNREQLPWSFPASFKAGAETWTVETEWGTVPEGDYALSDFPGLIAIERKNSIDELIGNFTVGRERFWRELDRLRAYETVLLIVETGSMDDARRGNYRSAMTPVSLVASIHAVEEMRIPVLFPGSRERAAAHCLQVFRRFIARKDRKSKAVDAGGGTG